MGKWRAANGHARPYNVKLWNVGNEPWGDYQMGAMPVEQFAIKHNLFANAMHKIDPSIKLVAGGAVEARITLGQKLEVEVQKRGWDRHPK